MDDLVAVEVKTDAGRSAYFMTWGRIQHAVDGAPLEALAIRLASRFAISGRPVAARVCDSLQEAHEQRYFYEALVDFAQKPIPFGLGYDAWRELKRAAMEEGREFYYLGRPLR